MILLAGLALALLIGVGSVSTCIAVPLDERRTLDTPLRPLDILEAERAGPYWADFAKLREGFTPQEFRSFCGPATIATVLGAYGIEADQHALFPSITAKANALFTGMSLADVGKLASFAGLDNRVIYADQLNVESFRALLKSDLSRDRDYIVVNYDRGALGQKGSGHISVIGAYDSARDEALVLDAASYRYPFTWIAVTRLYEAVHARAGERFRGVLVIAGYHVRRVA